jgi:2-keto-myo-inositol isomerase
MQFCLNHMVAPHLDYRAFFELALRLGVTTVEIRNDIAVSKMGNKNAKMIAKLAKDMGITIFNVNALQRWNQWNSKKADEAKRLAEYTALTGAKSLILVPTNDTKFRPTEQQRKDGILAGLSGLKPILADHGLIGYVEPLGFAECSLRKKAEAIAAIKTIGGAKRFKLTHDTFHHFVSGEKEVFGDFTGLIHVSGMSNKNYTVKTMRDAQRELVDAKDRIDNKGQVKRLMAAGYKGLVSFEPFAASVHKDKAIARSLARSMDYLES